MKACAATRRLLQQALRPPALLRNDPVVRGAARSAGRLHSGGRAVPRPPGHFAAHPPVMPCRLQKLLEGPVVAEGAARAALIGFGADVEIKAPPSLRQAMRELALDVLSLYPDDELARA